MSSVELVIVGVAVYLVTFVGGVLIALRFQKAILDRETEKRIALIRSSFRYANQQIEGYELQQELYRDLHGVLVAVETSLKDLPLKQRVNQAVHFIQKHIDNPLTIQHEA